MFAIKQALLLACLEPDDNFFDGNLQWVGDIASPGGAFEIAAIFHFPLMKAEDRGVYLHPPNPDCRLWGERDPAALYFPAIFFRSPHICLSLFVYLNDFLRSLCIGIRACVRVVQAF